MRQQALNIGYSMNEHGFTDLKTKKKLNFNLSTEKDVFKFLNIEYKHPTDRIDGTSVVNNGGSNKDYKQCIPCYKDDSFVLKERKAFVGEMRRSNLN